MNFSGLAACDFHINGSKIMQKYSKLISLKENFFLKVLLVVIFAAGATWIGFFHRQLVESRAAQSEAHEENLVLENRVKGLRTTNNALINDVKELVGLAGVSLADCTPSSERWFNHDFGFPVAGYERTMIADLIKKRMNAAGAAVTPDRFELIFDRNALTAQYHLIKDISIINKKDRMSVTYHPSSKDVTAVDFLLIAFNDTAAVCSEKITLHFAPKTPKGAWQAELVIGRGGIKSGALSLPYGTEFHDGFYWTTDCSNEKIAVFNLQSQLVKEIRSDVMVTPADIKIHKEKIYVVDETEHNVKVFGMNGALLETFGENTKLPVELDDSSLDAGKLNRPLGVAVTDELIVIVDYGNNRVQGYDHDWNLIWLSMNLDGDEVLWDYPYYIEYLPERGLFAVTNRGADEIVLLDKTGRKLTNFGSEVLDYPHEIAVTNGGDLLVANYADHNVVIFSGLDDFKSYETVDFEEGFGLAKTVTSIDKDRFVVGFINDSGNAYQVLMSRASMKTADVTAPQPEEVPMNNTAVTTVPAFASTDPRTVQTYMDECAHCHESGQFNAPIRRNLEHWHQYRQVPSKQLVAMMQGAKHRQFEAGTCEDCSTEELVALTDFLRPKMQSANDAGQFRGHEQVWN